MESDWCVSVHQCSVYRGTWCRTLIFWRERDIHCVPALSQQTKRYFPRARRRGTMTANGTYFQRKSVGEFNMETNHELSIFRKGLPGPVPHGTDHELQSLLQQYWTWNIWRSLLLWKWTLWKWIAASDRREREEKNEYNMWISPINRREAMCNLNVILEICMMSTSSWWSFMCYVRINEWF